MANELGNLIMVREFSRTTLELADGVICLYRRFEVEVQDG